MPDLFTAHQAGLDAAVDYFFADIILGSAAIRILLTSYHTISSGRIFPIIIISVHTKLASTDANCFSEIMPRTTFRPKITN